MTAPCTVARTLRDGDVVGHRTIRVDHLRDGTKMIICSDCGRKWAVKGSK